MCRILIRSGFLPFLVLRIALFDVCHGADALFLPFGENAFRVLEARLADLGMVR